MPGENLTRLEAQTRAEILKVDSYRVDLNLVGSDKTFLSTTTVEFQATAGASSFIDLIAEKVHKVVLNGTKLDPAAVFADSRIELPELAEQNTLLVEADARYTNTGEGLHRFVDPADGEVYLYSQFEVPDSRRVFAVFEQPDLKATFQFNVIAPAKWKVISNQAAVKVSENSAETTLWEFGPTPRISSYITALIAGPYESVHSELTSSDGRTIPLGVYGRKSLFQYLDADYIFEKTRQGFKFYEELFDYPYPFDKYDQLFVPEFNAGAMENAGAVTFTETYVFRSKVTDAIKERRVVTILHELAHMWFGDLVTMKWWNDLWLNESFAEYMSTLATAEATEWHEAWTTFAAMEKAWAYKQDQLPSTHPVVAEINDLEDVQVNFDGITYAKGGSVLKQLVAWVGRENFFAGVASYFKKHAFGNTQLSDLFVELEKTSGRDLSEWSKLWLETAGVNTLRAEFELEDGKFSSFSVLQTAHPDYPTIRPHRTGIGFYDLVDDQLKRSQYFEVDLVGEKTELTELVGQAQPDLVLLNDEDLAYAKIRLDAASFRTALQYLGRVTDPLARSLIWGSAWDATRDGEIPARDYVELVLSNIGFETESTTVRTTLTQLLLAARQYVAPETRDDTIRKIGDSLWQLALSAESGSDSQFQFVKFFAQIASTEQHYKVLSQLRSSELSLPGLEIDTDLAWELLEGLALGGKVSESEVKLALAKDNTANGQQAAARVLATLPTKEAKKAAFDRIVLSDNEANAIIRAVTVGFQHVNEPAVLSEIVSEYFGKINEIWNSRSYHIAETLIVGLYPAPLANQELVEATENWLAENQDSPALRRLVKENLAGVTRSLLAQQKDSQA